MQTKSKPIHPMPATLKIQARFLDFYQDPRCESDFDAGCYPSESGSDRPALEGMEELKEKFKAVYARRNACERALSHLTPGSPKREGLTQHWLTLTEAVDHLEDVCAPIGFIAEPVKGDGLLARELIFTHPPRPAKDGAQSGSSFSLYIPIPTEGAFGEEVHRAS
jgi:hypothetical protein